MSATFCATALSIETHQGEQVLALFNDSDDYLFLQAPLDEAQRGDGVYIELNHENCGGYDVLAALSLNHACLQLSLKSPLTGMDEHEITVQLSLADSGKLPAFGKALAAMFAGRLPILSLDIDG